MANSNYIVSSNTSRKYASKNNFAEKGNWDYLCRLTRCEKEGLFDGVWFLVKKCIYFDIWKTTKKRELWFITLKKRDL